MELSQLTSQSLRERNEHDAAEFALAAGKDDGHRCEEEEEQEEESRSGSVPANSGSGSNAEEDDDDDDDAVFFSSDEEANNARAVGLKCYNEGRYEDALDVQYRIVRYFDKKYGATAAICGPYFLDYGLSQLRVMQLKSSVEAALQPLDQDALESCFVNLDVARVCFQKQEEERGEGDMDVQLSLAEVHNAIAQLHVEHEDFDGALKEYESELLTYRFIQQEAPGRLPYNRLAGVLYGIADCYMKEGDFEGAEERYAAALEEIRSFPPGAVSAELVSELEELRDDAREMKGGKYSALQAVIQEQFAVREAEDLPTAQEFYGASGADGAQQHPYVSQLPGEPEYSALSMPHSLANPAPWSERSNSMSRSLFPPQGGGCSQEASNSQPVHHVVARRRPKKTSQQQSQSESRTHGEASSAGESEMKRLRTESCS